MQIGPGTRLGSYEIVSTLGAGGMGEVYRALDLRLGRFVAIKVLPEAIPLFELEERAGSFAAFTTHDGERFIVVRTLRPPRNGIAVVQNWISEFVK